MADRARVGTGDLGGVRPAGEEAGGVAFPVESGYTAPMGIRDRPGGSTTRPLRVAADSVSSTQRHAPCSRRRGLQFHVEAGVAEIDRFVAVFPGDAASAEGGSSGIRAASTDALNRLAPLRDTVLDRFAAIVGER